MQDDYSTKLYKLFKEEKGLCLKNKGFMEIKFLEEINKALEDKILLREKNMDNMSKNLSNFLLSGIFAYIFFDTDFFMVSVSLLPFCLYNLKKLSVKLYETTKLELDIERKLFISETSFYKEVLKEYKELILKLTDLFDKNKINSLVDIQSSFVFMQKNGYLSENHSWKYKSLRNYIYLKNMGLPVFGGYGVCRDLSYMLNYLLENMNFDTIPLLIKYDLIETDERLYSLYNIENLCQILKVDLNNIPDFLFENDKLIYSQSRENNRDSQINHKKVPFNHVIISTECSGKAYHFDPTNHMYFKNYDRKHITFYEEEYPLKVSFREYRKEKKHLLRLPNPDKEDIYNLYNEYYIKNLLEREKLYQKFYEDNKESYQRINEKVKIINKYWK